jgi:hypothetical protein
MGEVEKVVARFSCSRLRGNDIAAREKRCVEKDNKES